MSSLKLLSKFLRLPLDIIEKKNDKVSKIIKAIIYLARGMSCYSIRHVMLAYQQFCVRLHLLNSVFNPYNFFYVT